MMDKSEAPRDHVLEADEPQIEPQDLITFMQSSPLAEAIAAGELDPEWFERSREDGRDSGREIDLSWAEPDA